jgi:hypothetical protein
MRTRRGTVTVPGRDLPNRESPRLGSKETLRAIAKQRGVVQKTIRDRQQAQDDEKAAKAELKRLTEQAFREMEAENQSAIDNPTPDKQEPVREWAA